MSLPTTQTTSDSNSISDVSGIEMPPSPLRRALKVFARGMGCALLMTVGMTIVIDHVPLGKWDVVTVLFIVAIVPLFIATLNFLLLLDADHYALRKVRDEAADEMREKEDEFARERVAHQKKVVAYAEQINRLEARSLPEHTSMYVEDAATGWRHDPISCNIHFAIFDGFQWGNASILLAPKQGAIHLKIKNIGIHVTYTGPDHSGTFSICLTVDQVSKYLTGLFKPGEKYAFGEGRKQRRIVVCGSAAEAYAFAKASEYAIKINADKTPYDLLEAPIEPSTHAPQA